MKTISTDTIKRVVEELVIKANFCLRPDVESCLKSAYSKETNKRAKGILKAIMGNALIARREKLAICQDTGMPTVYLEIGQNVKILGDLKLAVNRGVEDGYRAGFLRKSIISNPLLRGKPGYLPAIIHTDIVKGNNLKIIVLPKGFGCENKSALKMFKPTAKIEEIKKFVIDTVKAAGADACPPYVIGVGIGGSADHAVFLSKKALLKNLGRKPQKMGSELFNQINRLNIGPMGLGGKTTCLAVNVETYPTHIAGLPVAVNLSCHALRSASKTI